jgi:Replicase family
MLACHLGETGTAATLEGRTWEWSKDPDIWPKQFEAALTAKGLYRPRKKASPKKRIAKELPPATCWEEAFERTMPGRPLCGDDFPMGVYPCRRELALGFRYIQYNRPTLFRYYVADVDRAGASNAWRGTELPPPSLIMINPANDHAHLAWLLSVPVSGVNPYSKPFRFLSAIERGFTRRLDADRAFVQHGLVKNALHSDWRVSRPFEGSYTLHELAAPLKVRDTKPLAKGERETGLGRNCALFDWLRALAYKQVLKLKHAGADYEDFLEGLLGAAVDMNLTADFYRPLSQGEVFTIVKSVARWTWCEFWPERFSARQSWCGSRGMAKRWADHTSLDKSKPWEAEGISRRMWFYRKAKEVQPQPIAL